MPLEKLSFDFEASVARVDLLEIDYSDSDKYVQLSLLFKGIRRFESLYPEGAVFNPDGCREVVCSKEPNGYLVVFLFTLDNFPLWEVRIGFESLEIEGGLSTEAIAYRDKVLSEG